jgi:hypothetical protein
MMMPRPKLNPLMSKLRILSLPRPSRRRRLQLNMRTRMVMEINKCMEVVKMWTMKLTSIWEVMAQPMILQPTMKHMDLASRKTGKIAIYFFDF